MLKRFTVLLLLCALPLAAADIPRLAPAEAAKLVAAGSAVLIDVREPGEWFETGVAAPAVLLPKSDFDAEQFEWKPFLKKAAATKDQTLILYCRSGRRADEIAAVLREQGFAVANAGGLKDWIAAGLPTRAPNAKP